MRGTLFVSLLLLAPACFVRVDDGPDDTPDGIYECPTYTAEIFEPADGAVVASPVTTRVRWNADGIPDRYMAMSDDYGNYFTPSGLGEVRGDGSLVDTYDLPAGGTFELEIGWYCDAGNNGPEVKLAAVRFSTQ